MATIEPRFDPMEPAVPTHRRRIVLAPALAGLCSGLWAGLGAPAARAHGERSHAAASAPLRFEQKPWGIGAPARAAQRTIAIRMLDTMRFVPDRIELRLNETVRLALRNEGRLLHELVLGTKEELDAHARLMEKHPGMEHDEPWMAHVAAGRRGQIVWHFNRAGTFHFACLIPGHYSAGMVGTLVVRNA